MGLFGNLFKDSNSEKKVDAPVSYSIEEMVAKAEQCIKGGKIRDYIDAAEWFSKAEECGDDLSALKAAACCSDIAEAFIKQSLYGGETFEYWKKSTLHAMAAMRKPDNGYFEYAMQYMRKGLVGMAFANYMGKQADNAMNEIGMIGDTDRADACLLKALCLIEVATSDDELKESERLFKAFLCDEDYMSGVGEKGTLEQVIVSAATLVYHNVLTKGVGNSILKDESLAAAVANYAYSNLTLEVARKPLETIISG